MVEGLTSSATDQASVAGIVMIQRAVTARRLEYRSSSVTMSAIGANRSVAETYQWTESW
jgi:hypothetical protein